MQPIIKTENLSVTYFLGRSNQVNALANANIEIYPGEFIIFFGPSGCGKSTLLYAIAGLEKHITGNIYIEGQNLSKFNNKQVELFHQKKIGMVFQAYYLISSLNILDNVVLPQFSVGVKTKERKAKALELLEHFGVKPQSKKFPNELSGGQQQRVAICRSLINDPDIIFADEPTGNLDSKSADDVMGLLKELNEKKKKTVILVTHSPEKLGYANRVIYMSDSKIIYVKLNEPAKTADKKIASQDNLSLEPIADKNTELLVNAYSSFSKNNRGELLALFKAKQLVAEALSDKTLEEISVIESKVQKMLIGGIREGNALASYLDDNFQKGGLGMDTRSAQKLIDRINGIVTEIKLLEEQEAKMATQEAMVDSDEEVRHLRHYLFDAFNVDIKAVSAVERVNQVIKNRLDNKIDKNTVRMKLDLPLDEGGVGLDSRTARKIARRLELLMLGKYKPRN